METSHATDRIPSTDHYVVFGNPIAHSKSPLIHSIFAEQTGQSMQYQTRLAALDGFAQSVHELILSGAKGANVTLPFKLEAYALCTQLSARAKLAGAVNTLSFEGGEILGENTDGIGLVTDIVENAGFSLKNKKILLLGAGGAARGVLLPLLEQQPAELVIANRSHAKAQQLVDLLKDALKDSPAQIQTQCEVSARLLEQLDTAFDLIINATSSSLSANSSAAMPPISEKLISSSTLAYDMMYGATPSRFLEFSKNHGAQCRDGLGMLVEQAAQACLIWRGVRPETSKVLHQLRAAVGSA